MTHATASVSFEIELDVSGTITPAYAGDFYCPPNGIEAEPDCVEGVFGLQHYRVDGKSHWRRVNLLDGVDATNPGVVKLINNLLAFASDDVETALIDAVAA